MLALGCLVSAAVCINKITPVSVSTILHQEWIIYSLTTSLSSEITIDLPMRTQAAAGWIIFLSIVVLFYQTFAVVQMFLYIPLLYMKIPIRKTFWYLFPLIVSFIAIFSTSYQYVAMIFQDVGVNIVCIIGYLPVTIATAVYTYQWIEMLVKIFQEMDSRSRSSGSSDSETQGLIFQQYLLNILVPIIITFVSS